MQNAPREHSVIILLTFIEPPFVFKTFVLSIFEWRLRAVLLYLKMPLMKVLADIPSGTRCLIIGLNLHPYIFLINKGSDESAHMHRTTGLRTFNSLFD